MVSDHIRRKIFGCMKSKWRQSYNEPEEKVSMPDITFVQLAGLQGFLKGK